MTSSVKPSIDFDQVREQVKLLNDVCIWSRKASLNEHNINLLKNRELSSDIFNLEKLQQKHIDHLNNNFERLYGHIRKLRYQILVLEYDMKPNNLKASWRKRNNIDDINMTDYDVDQLALLRKQIESEVTDLKNELNKALIPVAPLIAERLKYLFTCITNEESSNGVDMSMVNNAIHRAELVNRGKCSADDGMEYGFKYTEERYKLPKNFFGPMQAEYQAFKKKEQKK